MSESNLLKIKSVLTLYSICAYISKIGLIGLLILGVQMGLSVLYLLVLLFTVNLLFPLPFLFYIKSKGYGKIENAGELTAKVPVFLLFVSTVLYYLGSLLIAGKVEQLFDEKVSWLLPFGDFSWLGFSIFMKLRKSEKIPNKKGLFIGFFVTNAEKEYNNP